MLRQRSGATGTIPITGTITSGTHDVQARWNGGVWSTLAGGAIGAWSGSLTNQPQGQGTLEVRLDSIDTNKTLRSHVGIGDLFGVAGQSNPSGRGTNKQRYSHPSLRGSLFANGYAFQDLQDPTDWGGQTDTISADAGNNPSGSVWPLLATHIMTDQSVPVGFVPCALGGSSITAWQPGADHQNRATLYGSMVYRCLQVGGVKAVLWWQGETDAGNGMSQATYNAYLDTLANAVMADLGVPLVACQLQNCSGANVATINAAIQEAWNDNANVVAGPDLSDIATDDNYHLMSDAKLALAASRWWTALETEFYP